MTHDFDLIVIGSGAGGGVAAHRAAALGKRVAVIERAKIGGECPNYGCVPTKALLQAAEIYEEMQNAENYGLKARDVAIDYRKVNKWKELVVSRTGTAKGESTFERDGIKVLYGDAKFLTPHEIQVGKKTYSGHTFLIATGSHVFIPPILGLEQCGYITFKDAINFDNLPESMFILGGGPIGCEFAQLFSSFGVKVTIADTTPRLLMREDIDVSNLVMALFEQRGIRVFTNTTVTGVHTRDGKKYMDVTTGDDTHTYSAHELLIATGKRPSIESLELERAGVAFGKHGLKVNRYLQTTVPHIYAAGDVVGPYLFTHTAEYQSAIVAQNAFSRTKRAVDYRVVPRCTFVFPEAACVGLTEQEALEQKIKIKKGMVPVAILGRANTSNQLDGFVKVITDHKGKIIGGAALCARAGEVIHEIALAMHLNATAEQVASMIHAYPTFSEAVKFACDAVE